MRAQKGWVGLVYRTENMLLEPIHEVLHGAQNDVVICRDRNSPVAAKYTLWVVHDRGCIRALLDLFENSPRELLEGESPYLARFAEGESLCFLFDYRPPRPLRRFAPGQVVSVQQREQIGIDLVMACLSSPMPFAVLCLLLEQDCVNIAADGSVYFTYEVDLAPLNPADDEGVCTDLCVTAILALEPDNKKLKSMKLLHTTPHAPAPTGLRLLFSPAPAAPATAAPASARSQAARPDSLFPAHIPAVDTHIRL